MQLRNEVQSGMKLKYWGNMKIAQYWSGSYFQALEQS